MTVQLYNFICGASIHIWLYSCITLFVEQVCSLFAVNNSMQISWRLITWNYSLRQVYVVTEVLPEFHRTRINEWITKTEPDHNQKFSFDDLLSWRQEIKSFLSNEINLVIYHYFILSFGYINQINSKEIIKFDAFWV